MRMGHYRTVRSIDHRTTGWTDLPLPKPHTIIRASSKVGELALAIDLQQYVCRLQVPVHDFVVVQEV